MIGYAQKIQGGALQFAIFISVVIAIILGAFVLLTYTQLQFAKQLNVAEQLIQQTNDGLRYAQQQELPYDQDVLIDLEGDFLGVLQLHKSHWGIFDKVITQANSHQRQHQKIAWIGGQLPSEERPALYLADTNTPLVLVGQTALYGKTLLPEQGVKPGNIAGNYFQGEKLIHGSQGNSGTILPVLPREKRDYFKKLLNNKVLIPDSLYIHAITALPIQRSFGLPEQWFYSAEAIQLNHVDLQDHIIIKSDSLIRVSAFAKAKNVILVAPEIEIAANFKGNVQAIASRKITLGINATLTYPSALVMFDERNNTSGKQSTDTGIEIQQRATIAGSVVYINESDLLQQDTAIQLDKETLMRGEIYCEGRLEIKGIVEGSVFTQQCISKVKGSVYVNHLYDAVIDSRGFPKDFGGITTQHTEKKIVAWLD